MVKSSTKNVLGKILVKLGLAKVDVWTKRQLHILRYKTKFPLCVELDKNTWVIGKHIMKKKADHHYAVYEDQTLIKTFFSRKAAVLFASISNTRNQFHTKIMLNISKNDNLTGKMYDEMQFFRQKVNEIKSKNNEFKKHLYMVRYNESRLRFKQCYKELQKNLDTAKYIKVWDEQL